MRNVRQTINAIAAMGLRCTVTNRGNGPYRVWEDGRKDRAVIADSDTDAINAARQIVLKRNKADGPGSAQ